MTRLVLPLMALLPHGCCAFALFSGYWAAATPRMVCHGEPIIYPAVELSGLLLACLCLFDFWRGGGGYPVRGLAALCLFALVSWLGQMTVTNQIALSALSKAGQGYLLLQAVGFLLRGVGWSSDWGFCPACFDRR